jgi:exodeoxyribonuclease VII large subunit
MPPPDGTRVFSVSGVTNAVKLRLEEHFPSVWVAGEVSNFVRASSGHQYF